ncbi:MAG: hemolysin family protein [Candidatus Altimarinota bacterium]
MDPALIIIFTILFLLSAFFSASEIALMSLPEHKIDSLLKQNRFGSKALRYLKDRNDKVLITILIGNNLVNVYIAALATQFAITVSKSSTFDEALIVGASTGIITFLLLMFGEIVPKSYATKNAEKIALLVANFYKGLIIVLSPIIYFMEGIIKLTTGKSSVSKITDEEIEAFIDMGREEGVFEAGEHEKIKNMLEFSDITVEEIITPRVNIDAIDIETTVNDALDFVLNHTHSRIPVFIEKVDNIGYVVNLRFLLQEQKKGNGNILLSQLKNLDKAIKIPLNHPIDKLLEIFKNSRKHMAIVLDECGGVAGLVTLEDIIEEVFGDIRDEYDKERDEMRKIVENKYEVDPSLIFEDLLDELGIKFENLGLDEKDYYATTLNYFITEELERFPDSGEILEKELSGDGFKDDKIKTFLVLKIKNVIDNKIESVEVELVKKELLD